MIRRRQAETRTWPTVWVLLAIVFVTPGCRVATEPLRHRAFPLERPAQYRSVANGSGGLNSQAGYCATRWRTLDPCLASFPHMVEPQELLPLPAPIESAHNVRRQLREQIAGQPERTQQVQVQARQTRTRDPRLDQSPADPSVQWAGYQEVIPSKTSQISSIEAELDYFRP